MRMVASVRAAQVVVEMPLVEVVQQLPLRPVQIRTVVIQVRARSTSSSSSTSSNSSSSDTGTSTSTNSGSSNNSTSKKTSSNQSSSDDSGDTTRDDVASADASAPPSLRVIDISESASSDYNHTVDTITVDTDEGEIQLIGSGFSTGANIVLYDTFDNGGTTGTDVPLTNANNPGCSTDIFGLDVDSVPGPTIGCWTDYGTYHPQYSDIASHSGTHSMIKPGDRYIINYEAN